MNADGTGRREAGAGIDNRQGSPSWSADGRWVYFSVQERGHQRLYRLPAAGGKAEVVVGDPGRVESWARPAAARSPYVYASPTDLGQLYLRGDDGAPRKLTDLNLGRAARRRGREVEPFTFRSNDFKFDVEAYLAQPDGADRGLEAPDDRRHPRRPARRAGARRSTSASQHYAHRGWAVLMVNFRGSTGYGQAFADAVYGDQNGNEAQDVLYGASAALRRNPWIDRDRLGIEGGSYGGQLSAWLITQTRMFRAAIPLAPIINNVSYNYMTYYNMYEQMEWGRLPHQGNLMDVLWERSALKHVGKVATPDDARARRERQRRAHRGVGAVLHRASRTWACPW